MSLSPTRDSTPPLPPHDSPHPPPHHNHHYHRRHLNVTISTHHQPPLMGFAAALAVLVTEASQSRQHVRLVDGSRALDSKRAHMYYLVIEAGADRHLYNIERSRNEKAQIAWEDEFVGVGAVSAVVVDDVEV
ncbi:hypothetical protein Tco_1146145 [Tanacetum coccineum]